MFAAELVAELPDPASGFDAPRVAARIHERFPSPVLAQLCAGELGAIFGRNGWLG